MEEIKTWVFAICSAAICGAVFNMILPEGGAQKTYKVIFCVFFLSVLAAPITDMELPDFEETDKSFEAEAYNAKENKFEQKSVSIIEQKIFDDTASFLKEKGIIVKDISVKVNISEDGSIDINKFVLTLMENPKGLSEEIIQKIGIIPEIVILEEENNGSG